MHLSGNETVRQLNNQSTKGPFNIGQGLTFVTFTGKNHHMCTGIISYEHQETLTNVAFSIYGKRHLRLWIGDGLKLYGVGTIQTR